MSCDWCSVIPEMIGAMTGAAATLGGVIWYENRKERRNEQEEVRRVCLAFAAELQAALDLYHAQVKDLTIAAESDEGKYFTGQLNAQQNYFSVFDNLGDKLGLIKDDNLRVEIIGAYNNFKALIDIFDLNSRLLAEYKYTVLYPNPVRGRVDLRKSLVELYTDLLTVDEKIKSVDKLIIRLKEYKG